MAATMMTMAAANRAVLRVFFGSGAYLFMPPM
jgi:hypothetical protein